MALPRRTPLRLLLIISVLIALHVPLVVGRRHGRRVTHLSKPAPLQIAGSRLPDCSHACGSCSPCRLVIVSFVCATLQEAEACPIAYKCMCNSKSYPVP